MKKTLVSVLSILVLSFLFCSVSAEAKTRTGGTRGTSSNSSSSSSYTKPSTKTSISKPNSSSTTNTTTKQPTYSSITTKYPKSTRYFSGGVLSKTLVFGTAFLMINEANDDEPTYSDEEGNVYTLADLEEMDVQIPEDEPLEEDLYSETVSFDENQTAAETETVVPEEIETASSFDDSETYYEEESNSFNWLWLIIPLAVVVIVGTFFRKTKR